MEYFWSWGIGSLPLCTLPLCFRIVLVDPCFITCDDTAQNVMLPLQKVLANCDSFLLLFFGEVFRKHLCTHLPHVKIFSSDFADCLSVNVHLLCYASDSQPTIFMHNLTNFCNVFSSSACCWLSLYLFISDTFSSLRKTFHPLVNCCFLHSIIPVKLH